jgi:hypothetical protein
MEAGRELDTLVAEKVMGITPLLVEDELHVFTVNRRFLQPGDYYYLDTDNSRIEVPHYSTDIAAAWQVVERLHELHRNDTSVIYCLSLTKWNEMYYCGFTELKDDVVEASKAPLAICFAALKALESNLSRQTR